MEDQCTGEKQKIEIFSEALKGKNQQEAYSKWMLPVQMMKVAICLFNCNFTDQVTGVFNR